MPSSSEEPWDEMMGPPPSRPTISSSLVTDDVDDSMPLIRSNGSGNSGAGGVFTTSSRWSQYEKDAIQENDAATAKAVYIAANALAEREMMQDDVASTGAGSYGSAEDEYQRAIQNTATMNRMSSNHSVGSTSTSSNQNATANTSFDHETIREEALRMLEIADADRNYNVYRTVTGGYSASSKPKARSALSGINLSSARTNLGRTFRYGTDKSDPPSRNTNTCTMTDMEYGIGSTNSNNLLGTYEDDDVVDVMGMERRSLANRQSDQENHTNVASTSTAKSSNWSSRYSIDNTLLAMTGGTVSKTSVSDMRIHNDPYSTSNARILDRMDRESANKSTSSSGTFIKGAIFGSAAAFNYRQNNVFGKQNVVLPSSRQPNLQAAFITSTEGASSLPPVNLRSKSWSERLRQKQFQTRLLLAIGALLIVFIVSFTAIVVTKNHSGKRTSAASNANELESVTFYVTSDVPLYKSDESYLYHDLQKVDDAAKFIVHVGNIQEARKTECSPDRYTQIADFFKKHSPKTVFVVPGIEDWYNCPEPETSWETWKDSFLFFSSKFTKDADATNETAKKPIFSNQRDGLEIFRMKEQLENWAILESGVIFLGVHAISPASSSSLNDTEFDTRSDYNFNWVNGMLHTHKDHIRSIVIFGNAKPGTYGNTNFFAPLTDLLLTDPFRTKPTLYVHGYSEGRSSKDVVVDGNTTTAPALYQPFKNAPNLMAYSCMNKGTATPLTRMNVGFGDAPFIIG